MPGDCGVRGCCRSDPPVWVRLLSVVPRAPLGVCPVISSVPVTTPMASAKTASAPIAGRFQPRSRVPYVAVLSSSGGPSGCRAAGTPAGRAAA